MQNKPKSLQDILNISQKLKSWQRQSAATTHSAPIHAPINLAVLPPAIRARITVAESNEHILIIADTNATAQLLRFHMPKLTKQCKDRAIKLTVGGKKTLAATPKTKEKTLNSGPVLTSYAAELIRETAKTVTDKELGEALLRLASRQTPEK